MILAFDTTLDFMHATDYVLQHPELLPSFNLPEALWPRIRQSWDNRRNEMITGRFDFALSENGLKVYEYNADSASCYLETARLQAEWASHYGCKIGRSPGEKLYGFLVKAWRAQGIKDVLHIMQDIDAEETYHALFMKSAMEEGDQELADKLVMHNFYYPEVDYDRYD